MLNTTLKEQIERNILPRIQGPGQYIGGEWNTVAKDHLAVRGTLCLAFPDAYSIGMSHNGLQVLYNVMNRRDWACERVFMPLGDMEAEAPPARVAALRSGKLYAIDSIRRAGLHAAI